MADATVTVGLPVYNSERTLLSAVASLFAQTHEDWLLFIVDDGSTDDSLHLARSIADPRVAVLADGTNRGLGTRLNQLTSIAPTPLLFRMDSDDIMHPRRLEVQIDAMRSRPSLAMLGSRAYMIDDDDNIVGIFKEPRVGQSSLDWLRGCGLTHPTVVARTPWGRSNPYDESLQGGEDLDLWTRHAGRAVFDKVNDILLYYRVPRRLDLNYYGFIQRAFRAIVRRQDGDTVSWQLRTRLIASSHLKQWLARGAVYCGLDSTWQARRAVSLSPAGLQEAQAGLRQALAAQVPRR